MPRIQAIVVLYNMQFEASPSFKALQSGFRDCAGFADEVSLLVADNSPDPQPLLPGFHGNYLHDGENPGLARRYNYALARAVEAEATWLLLLDHDTNATAAYLDEALKLTAKLEARPEVAIIVPKLVMGGRILSPHVPPFRRRTASIALESSGVFTGKLRAFNSGSLLRVSALRAIGGFPEEYWLDQLDHATFHRIQQSGGNFFLMDSILEHNLTIGDADRPQSLSRLGSSLRAEGRFYSEHGTLWERMNHQFDLLRQVIGWARRGHLAKAQIGLKVLLRRS